MSNSKTEQRKCGLWLHAWLGVLFNQCVLYGITLVKVLSTRIVSISSTLSLILQPNPSMSENMCGLAIRSVLDGISHRCVTEAQRILCSLDSWDVTYRVRFAFFSCQQCLISSMESHWDMKLKSAASMCYCLWKPVSSLIPLMIVRTQSNLSKQWEEFAGSELRAALHTTPAWSVSVSAPPPRNNDFIWSKMY